MIIRLDKSTLFTVDPDLRFSREYALPKGTWTELWKRYKLLGYNQSELIEYFKIKTGRCITQKSLSRWIIRTEVFSMAAPAVKRGAESVVSSYFNDYEWTVIKLLTKNLKTSVRNGIKSLP